VARSITVRGIDRRPDRTYFRVEDQSGSRSEVEVSVNTLAELKDWVKSRFGEADEFLLAVALAVYFARDPDGTNPGVIVGRTLTLDLTGRINYPDAVVRVS
jgi:hypothetical protein